MSTFAEYDVICKNAVCPNYDITIRVKAVADYADPIVSCGVCGTPVNKNDITLFQTLPGSTTATEDIIPAKGYGLEIYSDSSTITASVTSTGSATFAAIAKSAGTSSQFLKADGSVDSTSYAIKPLIQYSTASVTNGSTASFIKPTGMTGIDLSASTLYKYEISIQYRVLTTNQIFKSRLNYPTLTIGTAHTVIGTNTTQVSYLGGDIELTGTQMEISSTTSTNSGATVLIQRTDGFLLTSASGTFSYEFAPNTSSATVYQNSYMLVTPVTSV